MPDNLMSDLFAGFDPATVAAIEASHRAETEASGRAQAMRRAHRLQVRRAKGEATLAELLPARFAPGESWHVISHGDIDALSYLTHAIAATHFDYVAVSTWCIARPDLEQIARWLDAGRIDAFELYAGEIFPSQYTDEHELALQMVDTYGIRLCIARNHSKLILAANESEGYHLVMEGSANVNTNPRIEQTAIHASAELFRFYQDFYRGLRSIDRRA